jgi:hypothetical protein
MTREALPRKASAPDDGYGDGMYHTATVLSIGGGLYQRIVANSHINIRHARHHENRSRPFAAGAAWPTE